MSAKPIVDGLAQQYASRLQIVRVDLLTPAGRELGARYDFSFTPYFVAFDPRGQVAWSQRGSVPTSAQLDQLIAH